MWIMDQLFRSIFQAAYDFAKGCLLNNIIQVHKFLVEKAVPHVGNENSVGSLVIIWNESIVIHY